VCFEGEERERKSEHKLGCRGAGKRERKILGSLIWAQFQDPEIMT